MALREKIVPALIARAHEKRKGEVEEHVKKEGSAAREKLGQSFEKLAERVTDFMHKKQALIDKQVKAGEAQYKMNQFIQDNLEGLSTSDKIGAQLRYNRNTDKTFRAYVERLKKIKLSPWGGDKWARNFVDKISRSQELAEADRLAAELPKNQEEELVKQESGFALEYEKLLRQGNELQNKYPDFGLGMVSELHTDFCKRLPSFTGTAYDSLNYKPLRDMAKQFDAIFSKVYAQAQ